MFFRRHPLLRFLATNAVIGVLVGWALFGILLYADIAGIGQLLARAEERVLVTLMALVGFGATFGGLAMGTAVFLLPKE